jgi:pimeloyl-ACP methyl ester carboxylesterase
MEFHMKIGLKWNLKTLSVYGFTILLAVCLHAQEITGKWQGTITPPQGRPMRMVLQVAHDDSGTLKARIYSIDQGPTGDWADFIVMQDSTVKFVVGMIQLSYEGKLSPDGNTITGTWTQGSSFPFIFRKATKDTAWALPVDPTSHVVQFVTVEPGVKLEVLDWGGQGRPLVFLAGLGDTAHVFDNFAPKFTSRYHVYGITRRGFGASSYPTPDRENYSSDRLGDDVLAVLATLNLQKPVLIGHSIAGEELSSISSRHPEKVSGLIYLDPGYSAFYTRSLGDTQLDMLETRDKIEQLLPYDPTGQKQPIEALLTTLPQLEKDLQKELKMKQAIPPQASNAPSPSSPQPRSTGAFFAIFNEEQKYTRITTPCLAIFAVPHDGAFPTDPAHHAAAAAFELQRSTDMSNAFETGVPSAKVVRLRNANHYLFRSNEAEVFDAMNVFLSKLAQP